MYNSAIDLKKFWGDVQYVKEKKNSNSENGTLDNNFIEQIKNKIAFLDMSSSSDMSNTKQKSIRLRGGVNVQGNIQSDMVNKAIESARKHGANLIQGKLNQSNGDCAFDSVMHNINFRDCFQNKLPLSPLTYRVQWMTNLQNQEPKISFTRGWLYCRGKKRELGLVKTFRRI